MSEVHSDLPGEPPHARYRLPRRSKAKSYDSKGIDTTSRRSALNNKNINTFRVSAAEISNPGDKSDTGEPLETRTFEFVTITSHEPSEVDRTETSKKVRTQTMRDYLRKQTKEAITGIPETVSSVNLEEPSRYKGRFKLNTWSHKSKTKATNARKAKSRDIEGQGASQAVVVRGEEVESTERLEDQGWQPITAGRLPNSVFSVNGRLDPFNSLAIQLGPHSENLLVYYSTTYRMNSVAVNAEGDFFSYVKTDPALFHSILYLVALSYDLRYGLEDSPVGLYHGGEAFRIINERIAEVNGVFSGQTIGAVAMLVNKENINGRYDLSKVHMQGLEMMVRMRGGIQSLRGVFRRIVTWCDFCFATVWDCQPLFPRIPPNSPPTTLSLPTTHPSLVHPQPSSELKPSHLFGSSSPIIPIFTTLRSLSTSLSASNLHILNRISASTQIYNLEYDLSLLNTLSSPLPNGDRCPFSWEAIPLKIAAHLYLWLVIRELPPTSELLYTVVKRLKNSLEMVESWWEGSWERQEWLLWILFVGAVAGNGRVEREWFVGKLGRLCRECGVWDVEGLRERLGRVVLQEGFFEWHLGAVWEDVLLAWEVEGGVDGGFEQFEVQFEDELMS